MTDEPTAPGAVPEPLIDQLPMSPYFFDDREAESLLVEDLREGRISIVCSITAEIFEPILRAKLGKLDAPLTWADWAEFRYYLQLKANDYLLDLSLADFPLSDLRPALVGGPADEAVDMASQYTRAVERAAAEHLSPPVAPFAPGEVEE